MEINQTKPAHPKNSRGGVLVLVALLLVVFVSIAALAIDIGYLSTTKNELQNVADAAALAGAGYLGSQYAPLSPSAQGEKEFTRAEIVQVVQDAAQKNKAAGIDIFIDDDRIDDDGNFTDIVIGLWNSATLVVDPTLKQPDAVSVIARRDDEVNSQINTFFAKIFDIDSVPISAEAAAALSGPATVAEGELNTPIGLSEAVFKNKTCKDSIFFSPTGYSCAAWTNLSTETISSNSLSERIFDLVVSDDNCQFCGTSTDFIINGNESLTLNGLNWLNDNFNLGQNIVKDLNTNVIVPATSSGQKFSFIGGETSQFGGHYLGIDYDGNTGTPYKTGGAEGETALTYNSATAPSPMFAMFDYFKYRDNDTAFILDSPLLDRDGSNFLDADGAPTFVANQSFEANEVWSTSVPVYKDLPNVDCNGVGTNATGLKEIVGFARIKVFQPNRAPAKDLVVKVDCNITFINGRSGGGTIGNIKGTIPNLVK